MIEFRYRPDVDGLRAVAVILVLLFHAGFGFSGGFIGVDVFFVISGFLITGLIVKEQRAGQFSMKRFWLRRIRRIVPAASFVVAACLVAGVFLLLPADLEQLSESAIAQQLMCANIYFLNTANYFGGPSELKPLLHTWSLAVEEQFYLGFPLLLVALGKLSDRVRLGGLIALAVLSFLISEWGVRNYENAAFYLLPSRAWELLIGALIVFLPTPSKLGSRLANLLSGIGLGLIVLAAWRFDGTTRFPGAAAIVPCMGTGLVIYANTCHATLVGDCLKLRPVVFVGLISYSLYLWHWPILALTRYWLGRELDPVVGLLALVTSFAAAILSWRFIETPFRLATPVQWWKNPVFGAVASVVILLGGSAIFKMSGGFEERLPQRVRQFTVRLADGTEFQSNTEMALRGEFPMIGKVDKADGAIDFIVWGDSHALALGTMFDELGREHHVRGMIAARSAAPPLLGTRWFSKGQDAINWNNAVLDQIKRHQIKNVILVSRWALYIEGRPGGLADTLIVDEDSSAVSRAEAKEAMRRGLLRTIEALELSGAKVWIVGQVPEQRSDPSKQLVAAAFFGRRTPPGIRLSEHWRRQANVYEVFESDGIELSQWVDPEVTMFDDLGWSRIGDEHGSYYRDEDHLSNYGASTLIKPLFDTLFQEIAGSTSNDELASRESSLPPY